jgi:hypothetical protein
MCNKWCRVDDIDRFAASHKHPEAAMMAWWVVERFDQSKSTLCCPLKRMCCPPSADRQSPVETCLQRPFTSCPGGCCTCGDCPTHLNLSRRFGWWVEEGRGEECRCHDWGLSRALKTHHSTIQHDFEQRCGFSALANKVYYTPAGF